MPWVFAIFLSFAWAYRKNRISMSAWKKRNKKIFFTSNHNLFQATGCWAFPYVQYIKTMLFAFFIYNSVDFISQNYSWNIAKIITHVNAIINVNWLNHILTVLTVLIFFLFWTLFRASSAQKLTEIFHFSSWSFCWY